MRSRTGDGIRLAALDMSRVQAVWARETRQLRMVIGMDLEQPAAISLGTGLGSRDPDLDVVRTSVVIDLE